MGADNKTRLGGLVRNEVENIDALLPYVKYHNGRLSVYETLVENVWDGDRPLLVFFPERAVENYNELSEAFRAYFDVSIYFALKSCYVPAIGRALRRAGSGAEVMTDFEWALAHRMGFRPDATVVNGMARRSEYRELLLQSNPAVIGVDGIEELSKLIETAAHIGARPKVTVRINPFVEDSFFAEGTKLGTPVADSHRLLEHALTSKQIDLVGVHAHQLRQCTDPQRYHLLAKALGELVRDASSSTRRIEIINLGGGLESRFLMTRSGHTCGDFAKAAHEGLGSVRHSFKLILEPGRFLVSDAAIAFTRILGIKAKGNTNWAMTEIGSNILTPSSDRPYPPVPLVIEPMTEWQRYSITDVICVPNSFCVDAELPSVTEGTSVAMLNSGAYAMAYAESWGTTLPDIGIYENAKLRQVFGAEDRERMLTSLYKELDPVSG